MESIIELFEAVASSDNQDESFVHIVKTCEDHKVLTLKPHSKIQPIVGHINRKLNNPSSRANGLLLLKALLPQCSDEVFRENATSWMLQCVKGVEGHSDRNTGQISFETLKLLLQLAAQLPELTKPVTTTVVPKLLNLLDNISHQTQWLALQCLEVLLRNYGGSCGPHRGDVEQFVLNFVDDTNDLLVLAAGRCAALFPLMGGGGTGGQNHRNAWLSLQKQLLSTMNSVLDELFQNITEIQNVPGIGVSLKLALSDIAETNPMLAVHRLTRRFINLARFFQCMFRGEFPVAKTVCPEQVLGLVCRGLAVTTKTLGKVSSEKLALSSVLPQIHLALLNVLRSLLACCGSTLLQYGSVICKLVLQTLKWTSVTTWPYGTEKPYGKLRVEACNTLIDWLVCAKTGSCVELHADQLIMILRAEILSTRPTVTLSVQKAPSKYFSKQQRKMLDKKKGVECDACDSDPSSIQRRLVDQSANNDVCRAALKALMWIIKAGGLFIQPSLHKSLQETVLLLVLDIQRASGPTEYPPPYSLPSCRLELYSLLLTLTLEAHPSWPAPTQYALCVLASGQADSNIQVSSFCSNALSIVRALVQPHCPTLEFPKPVQEMEESVATASTPVVSVMPNGDVSLDRVDPASKSGSNQIPNMSNGDVTQLGDSSSSESGSNQVPNEPLGRKKRSRSPDVKEVSRKKKQAREKPLPGKENEGNQQEIIVESGEESDSDDIREVYQSSSPVGKKSTQRPSPDMIVEEKYLVEEVDSDCSRYRSEAVHRKKLYKVDKRPSTMSSQELSPLRITEIFEEDSFSFEVQQQSQKSKRRVETVQRNSVSGGRSQVGVIDLGSDGEDSRRQNARRELSNRRNVSSVQEESCDIESSDISSCSSGVMVDLDVPYDDDDVIRSTGGGKNDGCRMGRGDQMNVAAEADAIEEIDLSKDDDAVGDDNEEEEEEEVGEVEEDNNEGSILLDDNECDDVEEDEDLEKEEEEVEEEVSDETRENARESKAEEINLTESENSNSNVAIAAIEAGNSNVADVGSEAVDKPDNIEEKTEEKGDENTKEAPSDLTEPQEEETSAREGPVDATPSSSVPTEKDCPIVENGTSEMEVDEEDMLASFVDVIKPDAAQSSASKEPQES